MLALRSVVAKAIAVASVIVCVANVPARAEEPKLATFLLFAGTDLWRDGAFLYGGALWAPASLDRDGFILKLIFSGGGYDYPSDTLQTKVGGTLTSAAALPGWHVARDGFDLKLYAGPVAQDYRSTPYDPGSRLHGSYIGGQFAADIWYQPNAATMIAVNGSIFSVGPTGSLRGAMGWRLFEPFFVGPEVQGVWCNNFQQLRFGAHLTGWRFETVEWSAAAGWELDSFQRSGLYARTGFNARY